MRLSNRRLALRWEGSGSRPRLAAAALRPPLLHSEKSSFSTEGNYSD